MESLEQLFRIMTHMRSPKVGGGQEQSTQFISHCGLNESCTETVQNVVLNGAHFCHSESNFSLRKKKNNSSSCPRMFPRKSRLLGDGEGPPSGGRLLGDCEGPPSGGRRVGPRTSDGKTAIRPLFLIVILLLVYLARVDCCSSRSTPKPRLSSPTLRPNVTFQTYACPPAYAAWFCLNGATCFTVKIQDAILYNCECAEGYMGPRCEFKDLDGSYLPARERVLLETASIAGGACLAIVLVFIVLFGTYIFLHKGKQSEFDNQESLDGVVASLPKYICTITSVQTMPVNYARMTLKEELQLPMEKTHDARGSLYIITGLNNRPTCTCPEHHLYGEVLCHQHSKNVLPL